MILIGKTSILHVVVSDSSSYNSMLIYSRLTLYIIYYIVDINNVSLKKSTCEIIVY